jgi:glycosyltransferase involved in cell wall biosynthesis
MTMYKPALSVLVCCYNNVGELVLCLQAITRSLYRDYELIVVDDGSSDGSSDTARQFTPKVFTHAANRGRSAARNTAAGHASSDILVFIDSDVLIAPDTLQIIADYFHAHTGVAALTGLLSKEHPNPDFVSRYKNLYMHYMFMQLPALVTFLYGSVHAIRATAFLPYGDVVNIADDTALGQALVARGEKIGFLPALQVVHCKYYNLTGFFKNDFIIPYDMAQIFVRYNGWKQLGKNNTGFVHASKVQLSGIVIAAACVPLFLLGVWVPVLLPVAFALLFVWLLLALPFLLFLRREAGTLFALRGALLTLSDHLVMAAGIICGMVTGIWKFKLRSKKG